MLDIVAQRFRKVQSLHKLKNRIRHRRTILVGYVPGLHIPSLGVRISWGMYPCLPGLGARNPRVGLQMSLNGDPRGDFLQAGGLNVLEHF